MANQEGKETAEDIYGTGGVVGTVADSIQGQQVTIQTTNTNTTTIPAVDLVKSDEVATKTTEEAGKVDPDETKAAGDEGKEGGQEVNPDDALAESLKTNIEAGKAAEVDLTAKGVDYKALEDEFISTGNLSEKSREILEKAGYAKPMVDAYLAGITATGERFQAKVYEIVGGAENYKQAAGFIKAQGKGYVDSFNKAIDSGDLKTIEMILKGVQNQITTKRGTVNPTVMGGGKPVSAGGFANEAEMVKAMSDTRYGRNEAYTKSVEAKVQKSTFFG